MTPSYNTTTHFTSDKSWDEFFLDVAFMISFKSRDPSTKVGCVITTQDNQILSVGYNGFPRGVKNYQERWEKRPEKYDYIVHAERNAILNAAREGRSTKGCKLYLFYSSPPCAQCTLSVIQAGIKDLILGPVPFKGVGNGKHYDTDTATPLMLEEAGVNIKRISNWIPPGVRNATVTTTDKDEIFIDLTVSPDDRG